MSRERRSILLYLAITVSALLLLAAGLPQLTFRPGRWFNLGLGRSLGFGANGAAAGGVANLEFWRMLLAAVAVVSVGMLLIGLVVSAELRREFLRRIAGVLVIFMLFYLALSLLQNAPAQPEAPALERAPTPAVAAGEPLPAFVAQPPSWLIVIIGLALAGLLVWGIWFLWRRDRTPANSLVALAQGALAELQGGAELQGTVLRCYLEMSQVLGAQRGVERQRATTPREFEQQLAAAGVGDEHIQRLTRMFERVRYGGAQASKRDELEAIDCLRAIVRSYRGGS